MASSTNFCPRRTNSDDPSPPSEAGHNRAVAAPALTGQAHGASRHHHRLARTIGHHAHDQRRLFSRRLGLTSMSTAKEDLHQLVDELPAEAVEPAARYLERARDPMIAILDAAPWDDETATPGEDAAAAAAMEEPGIPMERAREDLLD